MSAIDLLSIATKQIIVSRGSILESEGTLELLAGQGIHLLAALDFESWQKMFEASSGGVFGSSEKREESEGQPGHLARILCSVAIGLCSASRGHSELRLPQGHEHRVSRVAYLVSAPVRVGND